MIRVLIVEDSATMRQLLSEMLSSDPDIKVVGMASDPIVAREMIKALRPDVLTLDIAMPRLDGLAFLQQLMLQQPMPVVMVSALTQHGQLALKRGFAVHAAARRPVPHLLLEAECAGQKVERGVDVAVE